jgi:hypothetical protein
MSIKMTPQEVRELALVYVHETNQRLKDEVYTKRIELMQRYAAFGLKLVRERINEVAKYDDAKLLEFVGGVNSRFTDEAITTKLGQAITNKLGLALSRSETIVVQLMTYDAYGFESKYHELDAENSKLREKENLIRYGVDYPDGRELDRTSLTDVKRMIWAAERKKKARAEGQEGLKRAGIKRTPEEEAVLLAKAKELLS